MRFPRTIIALTMMMVLFCWQPDAKAQPDATPGEPAQASEHEPAAHGEDDVNIFTGHLLTSLMTVGVFVVLLLILGKFAWGPLLDGLRQREEGIRKSIDDARERQQEAQQKLTQYEQQLARAHEEAQELIARGRAEAIQLGEQLQAKAHEAAEKLRAQARRDVAAAKDQAVRDLYRQSYRMAVDLAGRIVAREVSPAEHQELIEQSLAQLEKHES